MIAYFTSASRVRCTSLPAMMRSPCYGIWANSGLAFLPGGNVGALVGGKGLRLGFEQAQSGYIAQRVVDHRAVPLHGLPSIKKHLLQQQSCGMARRARASWRSTISHMMQDHPFHRAPCVFASSCASPQQARQCQRHLIHREGSNSASCAVVC